MTAIAGYVDGAGTVWLGADSACSGGDGVFQNATPKVFRLTDALVVGVSGSPRAHDLLRSRVDPAPRGCVTWTPYARVADLAERWRNVLKDHGALTQDKGADELPNSSALVGYKGRLFTICPDFAVVEHGDRLAARGCAMDIVLGALAVLEDDATHGHNKVTRALTAAARFNAFVRAPFHIESVAP